MRISRTGIRPERRDAGYALLAAVAGLAVFGYIAFAMLAAERGGLAGALAQVAQARLAAAADGGLVLAASQLSARAWRIDGRPYSVRLSGMTLTIRIEDERGKIRLNELSEEQVRSMFENAGVGGRRLDEMTDAFLDWLDPDDDPRPFGAEARDYAALGYRPRNGPVRTVAEIALIRGMDRPLYRRIAPAATVFFGGAGAFSPSTAAPLAIAVMTGTGMGSPEVIERQRALGGQRTALEAGERENLAARPLTVRIMVEDGQGGRLERATIIEFPRGPGQGWEIRYQD